MEQGGVGIGGGARLTAPPRRQASLADSPSGGRGAAALPCRPPPVAARRRRVRPNPDNQCVGSLSVGGGPWLRNGTLTTRLPRGGGGPTEAAAATVMVAPCPPSPLLLPPTRRPPRDTTTGASRRHPAAAAPVFSPPAPPPGAAAGAAAPTRTPWLPPGPAAEGCREARPRTALSRPLPRGIFCANQAVTAVNDGGRGGGEPVQRWDTGKAVRGAAAGGGMDTDQSMGVSRARRMQPRGASATTHK